MKKFNGIIAAGCAAVMAISAMSMSAFAENSFQTIQTNVIEEDSASIPFVLSGTSDNNITANATIQMPVTQFDSVTMYIQSVAGGDIVFEGELPAEITDIPGILLGNGYYLEIIAISDGQKNVYKTDFVMYQKCIGKSDIISDELRVFTGDILTATASAATPDVDIQLALDSKYNEYLGSVQNNDAKLSANVSASNIKFTDINGHWAENTINKWADKGIISGYPDGTFKPDNPVTRAEVAKILTPAFDLQPSEFVSAMDEVSPDDWYYNYLLCAGKYIPNYALSEINEKNRPYIDNETEAFLPNQNAMRMHVAEALVEIIKDKNEMIDDVPAMSILKEEINKIFKDADYENLMASHGTIPTNVRRMFKYTYLAKELGIMQGDTDGYFRPYDNVTRAELITMLDRIIAE